MTTNQLTIALAMVISIFSISISNGQDRNTEGPYPVDKASERQEGVPQGELIKRKFATSKIFPGTQREYAIYVPAQYDAAKPACLMVFQDGMRLANEKGASKVPVVFDNLIHSGEMPVTIGVFIDPGVVPAQNQNALPRFNRSFEYDAIDDRYVNFLLDELLPEVTKNYQISGDPNDRGICGSSSGGIAAFNVAWQRPDQFRRVYTMVGTYIGLRGANEMSVLVRKTTPKPLRVFLQDGSNDLNIYCGDWWVANQGMLSALEFSGYEVDHAWGEGFHGQKHGGAIFPDAMRYLWKNYPMKVQTHFEISKSRASELLLPDSKWELLSGDRKAASHLLAADKLGMVFADEENGQIIRRTPTGDESILWDINVWGENKRFSGPHKRPYFSDVAIGANDEIYVGFAFNDSIGKLKTDSREFEAIVAGIKPRDLVVAHDGTMYFTQSDSNAVWMATKDGIHQLAGEKFSGATGIALSPDQTLLYVSDPAGRYVWSAVRKQDGTLDFSQPYFHIHSPPASVDVRPHSDGICVDQDGWVLVATKMGIQICDQPGRVNLIIPPPLGTEKLTNVSLGSDGTIFVSTGDKVYAMKSKLKGVAVAGPPIKPAKPRL